MVSVHLMQMFALMSAKLDDEFWQQLQPSSCNAQLLSLTLHLLWWGQHAACT